MILFVINMHYYYGYSGFCLKYQSKDEQGHVENLLTYKEQFLMVSSGQMDNNFFALCDYISGQSKDLHPGWPKSLVFAEADDI